MDLPTRLSYLFGSEEYVSLRRQLVFLREWLLNHQVPQNQVHTICSGSLGEGVAYPKSDDDVMIYRTDIRVVKTYREATQRGDLLMVPSEFSPGYCLLLDAKGSYPDNYIQIINGISFLSSLLMKESYVGEGMSIHGPCHSGNFGSEEFDFAHCIPCFDWPYVANDWILRNRSYDWPSCEIVENIIQNGCHVVPVGDSTSPHGHHEWRISFSAGERTLMHSFNHVQFLVYNLLRLTLKRIIGKIAPDVLCSYFMKTSLFYAAENTCRDLWRAENIEICFNTCLSVLYDYVDCVYCPNYFIPEYNMIKRKINHLNRHQMLDIIRYVHNIGILGVIHVSGESLCLDDTLSTRITEHKLDREFMFSAHIEKASVMIERSYDDLCHGDIQHWLYLTNKILRFLRSTSALTESGLINYISKRGIIISCQHMLHHLFISVEGNKRDYGRCKRLQYLLRQGYNADVTTGKLTMATYMYIVGKTESALTIIRQLLSEYPPYVMDGINDVLKVTTYIDTMCGRGYSIDHKIKRCYAPEYNLSRQRLNASLYPLRLWISIGNGPILDSLTYTFFLQSLCYFQQRNQRLLAKSTRCLVDHMDELRRDFDKADASMCVGIIKYVQGDSQSACRWLGSVYVMKDTFPKPYNKIYSLSALTYIFCLLSKQFQT